MIPISFSGVSFLERPQLSWEGGSGLLKASSPSQVGVCLLVTKEQTMWLLSEKPWPRKMSWRLALS